MLDNTTKWRTRRSRVYRGINAPTAHDSTQEIPSRLSRGPRISVGGQLRDAARFPRTSLSPPFEFVDEIVVEIKVATLTCFDILCTRIRVDIATSPCREINGRVAAGTATFRSSTAINAKQIRFDPLRSSSELRNSDDGKYGAR